MYLCRIRHPNLGLLIRLHLHPSFKALYRITHTMQHIYNICEYKQVHVSCINKNNQHFPGKNNEKHIHVILVKLKKEQHKKVKYSSHKMGTCAVFSTPRITAFCSISMASRSDAFCLRLISFVSAFSSVLPYAIFYDIRKPNVLIYTGYKPTDKSPQVTIPRMPSGNSVFKISSVLQSIYFFPSRNMQ